MGLRVAVVGSTGVVGTTMLELLRSRGFPADEIVPFASGRSAGRSLDGGLVVRALEPGADIEGFDVALFSAGAGVSREWAPRFVAAGATVVDNSSAFRRDPDVPLVVSEVNPHALEGHGGLIANPNCSTMQLMVALGPIQRAVGIERIVASTYQSVSGTGKKALDELERQSSAALRGEYVAPEVYPQPIAFNVIGAAGNFADGDDHTDEERKMMFETRKILEDATIGVAVTCVRVPVRVSHSIAVNVQTRRPLSASEVVELLGAAPGLSLEDDVPSPVSAEGRDDVFVGRIRDDDSHPRAFSMWVVSDNLRKGAATNAVQIAEVLVERGLLSSAAAGTA
jgi:aspartate-semialdehyde dehydrogenase